MRVKLFNKTTEIIILSDIGLKTLIPNSYTEFETITSDVDKSDMLIKHIARGDVIVNNYTNDMDASEGIKWLVTGAESFSTDSSGKIRVHETSKELGLYTYWTGRGDDTTGCVMGKGADLMIQHKIGDPMDQTIYVDFCNISNSTQLHEGYMIWDGAKPHDSASCSIVTSVIPVTAGENTNFNLYNGYLIIPAAGDGTIQPLVDITDPDPSKGCFVQMDTDEAGETTPAFWNATYNKDIHKFENITPAPLGDGEFNLFSTEITISRFVNEIHFIGSGFERLQSADSDVMTHGMRVKMDAHTSEHADDHEWVFSAILTLQRDKTA